METKVDIHKLPPDFEHGIDRVGVSGVDFLLTIKTADGKDVQVDATFDMFGSLLKDIKGIDMSRFSEVLMQWTDKPLSHLNFKEILVQLKKVVFSNDVYISSAFKYYMKKVAPVSKKEMMLAYHCRYIGVLTRLGYELVQEVKVPIMSVCPCSKELCTEDKEKGIGKGAHNQRGIVTIQMKSSDPNTHLEEIIKLAESSGSYEIFSLLKRPDEKFVTSESYDHPKFVEDIAREVAVKVKGLPHVKWFRIKVENMESIHNHSAVAYISREKRGSKYYPSNRGFY